MKTSDPKRPLFTGTPADAARASLALYLRPLADFWRSPHRAGFLTIFALVIGGLILAPYAMNQRFLPRKHEDEWTKTMAQMRESNERVIELQGRLADASSAMGKATKDQEETRADLRRAERSIAALRTLLDDVGRESADAKKAAEDARKEAAESRKESVTLAKAVKDTAAGLAAAEKSLDKARAALASEEESRKTLAAGVGKLRTEVSALTSTTYPYSGVQTGRLTLPVRANPEGMRFVHMSDTKYKLTADFPLPRGVVWKMGGSVITDAKLSDMPGTYDAKILFVFGKMVEITLLTGKEKGPKEGG